MLETDSTFCYLGTFCYSGGSPWVGFLGWDQAACFFWTTVTLYPQSRCRSVIVRAESTRSLHAKLTYKVLLFLMRMLQANTAVLTALLQKLPRVLQLLCLGTASPRRPL